MTFHFPFENTYARLPDRFFARVAPTPVAAPRLIRLNVALARELGLDPEWLAGPQGLEVLAGIRGAGRRRADRDGLCGPPVRAFRAAARRRPRDPFGRGGGSERRAA
jgi:hypothetical protein